MGIEIVQHHVQIAVGMVRHDLVHEVQELTAPTAGIVAGFTWPEATPKAANKVVVIWRV
jgi:hypothetical protein